MYMNDKLLTLQEVAEKLRVSKLTVWRYTDNGSLPAFKIGRALRIKNSDIDKFIESRRKQPKPNI